MTIRLLFLSFLLLNRWAVAQERISSPPTKPAKALTRFQITVGPEFAYYPGFLNDGRAWLNDSTGFGMKQNLGFSARLDYRLLKSVAVSLTAGYSGWELLRRYTLNGADEYSETKRLTQIPIQIGVKLYPISNLYIMPEGGANFLISSVKTSQAHPTPADESVNSTPIVYGANVGYEIRYKALLLDLSLRYQILNLTNLTYTAFPQNLSERVNTTSLRLGIGF